MWITPSSFSLPLLSFFAVVAVVDTDVVVIFVVDVAIAALMLC